jgi:hypothetical protein
VTLRRNGGGNWHCGSSSAVDGESQAHHILRHNGGEVGARRRLRKSIVGHRLRKSDVGHRFRKSVVGCWLILMLRRRLGSASNGRLRSSCSGLGPRARTTCSSSIHRATWMRQSSLVSLTNGW